MYANTIARAEEDENGEDEDRAISFLKAYTAFNIEQIENPPAHYHALAQTEPNPDQRIASAEDFFAATGADIPHGSKSANAESGFCSCRRMLAPTFYNSCSNPQRDRPAFGAEGSRRGSTFAHGYTCSGATELRGATGETLSAGRSSLR